MKQKVSASHMSYPCLTNSVKTRAGIDWKIFDRYSPNINDDEWINFEQWTTKMQNSTTGKCYLS